MNKANKKGKGSQPEHPHHVLQKLFRTFPKSPNSWTEIWCHDITRGSVKTNGRAWSGTPSDKGGVTTVSGKAEE